MKEEIKENEANQTCYWNSLTNLEAIAKEFRLSIITQQPIQIKVSKFLKSIITRSSTIHQNLK